MSNCALFLLSVIKETTMRAYLMMTAMAGAIFAAFTALPNRTEAMTVSTPAAAKGPPVW